MKSAMLLAAPMLIGAAQPLRLAPSTQWSLNYGENSCRLSRAFGAGENSTTLLFEQVSPRSSPSMVAVGKPLSAPITAPLMPDPENPFAAPRPQPVLTHFLPDRKAKIYGESTAATERHTPAVLWSTVGFGPPMGATKAGRDEMERLRWAAKRGERPPPRDLERERESRADYVQHAGKVTAVEIIAAGKHPVILETGSLGVPIRMLSDCAREQLRNWGVNPDLEDRIARLPWASHQERWFNADAYPQSALTHPAESLLETRLLVDAAGSVSGCVSLSHFQNSDFGKAVCDIYLKRGHFEPAELADGTKVPSYIVVTTKFLLQY